jgi:hypothetical protein
MTGGLSNPSGLCFPDASTGYEVSSSGVVAKYNGTGVLWPVSIKVSAGIRVFYDAKDIIIRMDHTRLHNIDALLYDLRGRIVAKVSGEAGSAVRIPTASLGSGMFLLSLNDRNGTSCTIPMVFP